MKKMIQLFSMVCVLLLGMVGLSSRAMAAPDALYNVMAQSYDPQTKRWDDRNVRSATLSPADVLDPADSDGVSPKIMAYAQLLGAKGALRVDANKYTLQEMPAEAASAFCTNVKTALTSDFPYMVIYQHPGQCVVFATEEEPSQEAIQEMIKGIFTDINGKKWLIQPVKPVQVNFQMSDEVQ